MNTKKILDKLLSQTRQMQIDNNTKIIMFSDCHRGDGSMADDFSKNQNLYFAALTHYFKEGYTYIELGDGDELWENKDLNDIKDYHSDVFWLLSTFYQDNRLYFIYGNHDIVKKSDKFNRRYLYDYYDESQKKYLPLFENIKIYESLVLRDKNTKDKIFLLHGHQADEFNSRFWKLARFLVRHLWRPLEIYGFNDPTSAAKNYKKNVKIAKNLSDWADSGNIMMIAGHTHKPVFPEPGESMYFNDGSCVHPRCITGIEISDGHIMLIKWSVKTKDDGTLYAGRDILAGPRKLSDYFK